MIRLGKQRQDTGANPCKDSSFLIKKTDDKGISVEVDDKNHTSIMIKDTNILRAREGGGKSRKKGTWTKKSSQ